MAKAKPNIIVYIHPDIQNQPYIDLFKCEFERYKSFAYEYAENSTYEVEDFMPALAEDDQNDLPSDHSLFGRDRVFAGKAANEHLYHVHINKPGYSVWTDATGNQMNQWDCTSDSALIYSYKNDYSGDLKFLLLELIDPGAHSKYAEDGAIEYWRKKALSYWTLNRK